MKWKGKGTKKKGEGEEKKGNWRKGRKKAELKDRKLKGISYFIEQYTIIYCMHIALMQ